MFLLSPIEKNGQIVNRLGTLEEGTIKDEERKPTKKYAKRLRRRSQVM